MMNITLPKTLPISKSMADMLCTKVKEPVGENDMITFNFRDPDYSEDAGGFHPVEIALVKNGDKWEFEYITDFEFFGGELVKSVDWIVSEEESACYVIGFVGQLPVEDSNEFYTMWEANFIAYVGMGTFEVEVTLN